jgi:L-rhamnose isomerase/sugar isomerase
MIQTVCTAQELYAKAALVDHDALLAAQKKGNIVDAELCLKKAFNTDVTEAIAAWRAAKGLEADPLLAHRATGYADKAAAERAKRRQDLGIATEHSYA